MAVRERALAKAVVVWARRAETREACAALPWCEAAFDTPEAAVETADLTVVCTPVDFIPNLVARIAQHLPEGALVTDVGSTKSLICHRCHGVVPNGRHFVGSHPMAGSEKTGLENAQANLFDRRSCFVTPLPETDAGAAETIRRFWSELGMVVGTATPEEHDEIVAHVSHLPHILASVLCSALARKPDIWRRFAGGGLRDTTRIAAGDPRLWRPILEQNREEVVRALDLFEDELQRLRASLLNEQPFELEDLLERGREYRESLARDVHRSSS